MRRSVLTMVLLLAVCVSLATYLEPRGQALAGQREYSTGLIQTLMGDSRRLFATHFLLKADAYFHSGFYPTIFDNPKGFEEAHLAEASTGDHAELRADANAAEQPEHAHDDHAHAHDPQQEHPRPETGFLGEPQDWIDRFSRHFTPASHSHLDGGQAGEPNAETTRGANEILPWLQLAAELDPNRAETYTLAAYWLRARLGKTKDAEEFLREGLRSNPGNPSILFELGRIYEEARNDPPTARNLWELALQKWREREATKKEPDTLLLSQIGLHLAQVEEKTGRYDAAISYWNLVKPISPRPEEIEKRMAELRTKQAEAAK